MATEQPHDDAARIPGAHRRAVANGEIGALLDAVERDVAAGALVRDAMRDRLGLVFPGPVPEADRAPVDLRLIRAYIEGTLPTSACERVCGLIWGDDQWGVAYVKMTLENAPGSRPDLLDRFLTEEKP